MSLAEKLHIVGKKSLAGFQINTFLGVFPFSRLSTGVVGDNAVLAMVLQCAAFDWAGDNCVQISESVFKKKKKNCVCDLKLL